MEGEIGLMSAADAAEWSYRGEGAANIVLAYSGTSPLFIGKVLRSQKVSANAKVTSENDREPVLSEEEKMLWSAWPTVVNASSSEALMQAFTRDVMGPLLGPCHVDPGFLVHVSREFLENVQCNIHEKRPHWRAEAGLINLNRRTALLMPDHSAFPAPPGAKEHAIHSISVEIKPKCGFLPDSIFIAEENYFKKKLPRFSLHQHLKLSQGLIERVSSYNPLDLFSGNYERILHAIQSLFQTPQNNLRVFIDGTMAFGSAAVKVSVEDNKRNHSSGGNEAFAELEESLENWILAEKGARVGVLQRLISECLFTTDALSRLLAAQKLDTYDIEGVIHAYYAMMKARDSTTLNGETTPNRASFSTEASDFGDSKISSWLSTLSPDHISKVIRNFLIAATAKDCSLMMTFQPFRPGASTSHSINDYRLITCPKTGVVFLFKIHFLDLDLKPLRKFSYYLKLDQEISKAYLNHLNCHKAKDDH